MGALQQGVARELRVEQTPCRCVGPGDTPLWDTRHLYTENLQEHGGTEWQPHQWDTEGLRAALPPAADAPDALTRRSVFLGSRQDLVHAGTRDTLQHPKGTQRKLMSKPPNSRKLTNSFYINCEDEEVSKDVRCILNETKIKNKPPQICEVDLKQFLERSHSVYMRS